MKKKGKSIFDCISSRAGVIPVDIDKLTQQVLTRNIKGKEKAQKFYLDYSQNGFDGILKNYGKMSYREKESMALHRVFHMEFPDKRLKYFKIRG